MPTPQVSVIIPTFNNADTIGRAIESVIRQSLGSWELIVVDDESTDRTRIVASGYQTVLGQRFRYVKQKHAGSSAARNTGIDRATGRFVAFLDADDEFLPDKLMRQIQLFERRPRLGLVFSDMAYVDLSGGVHESVFAQHPKSIRPFEKTEISPGLHVCGADFLDVMIGRYIIPTITAMVRREVLTGPVRFSPGFEYSEEWLFFLDVARRCEAGFVSEPLSLHHHRRGSLARTSATNNSRNQIRVLETILNRFPNASATARSEIYAQLAYYRRQLGMDFSKVGRYGDALVQFKSAMRFRKSTRAITDLVRAYLDVAVHGRGKDRAHLEPTREPVA